MRCVTSKTKEFVLLLTSTSPREIMFRTALALVFIAAFSGCSAFSSSTLSQGLVLRASKSMSSGSRLPASLRMAVQDITDANTLDEIVKGAGGRVI